MSAETTPTFIGRIGGMFRRSNRIEEISQDSLTALLDGASLETETPAAAEPATQIEPRTTAFLRPWGKREQAIDQLQNGVAALSDLMGSIRDNLERQSNRQDELLTYLSHLPEALQTLPETARVQGETLKAIQHQMEQSNAQQGKVADVLERIHRADAEQRSSLDAVQDRVDIISMQEESIGRNLTLVGTAMESVSRHSETSAKVLSNLHENLTNRDMDLERVIRRQNTRFTTMLTVAIVLSVAALTAVVVFGYLGYETLNHMR